LHDVFGVLRLRASDAVPFGPFLAISEHCVFVGTKAPTIVTELFRLFTYSSQSVCAR